MKKLLLLLLAGSGYSVIAPLWVILPILPKPSVNQRSPSGPAAMPAGSLLLAGSGNSVMVGAAASATPAAARRAPSAGR